MHTRTAPRFIGHTYPLNFAETAVALKGLLARWTERRRAFRYLQTMSDQHLNDLGLRRSDIWSTVYGQASFGARHLDD